MLRRNPDFVARELSDGLVLVPVTHEVAELDSVFALNPVGARIWELVEACETEDDIAAALSAEYEVEPAEALADVQVFLAQLKEIRAVLDG